MLSEYEREFEEVTAELAAVTVSWKGYECEELMYLISIVNCATETGESQPLSRFTE